MHLIDHSDISVLDLDSIVKSGEKIGLSDEAIVHINRSRAYLDERLKSKDAIFYGINTGFGSLCNVQVSSEDLTKLQINLVRSHACGTGPEIPKHIIKKMLYLKIRNMAYGHSGVHLTTVERLIAFFNEDVLPVVLKYGSLGASGDLAPLAHLSLPLIGEGEVYINGEKHSAGTLKEKYSWAPLELDAKEGIALLNGTQFMSSFASDIVYRGSRLCKLADFICALSLDAYGGKLGPFNALIHKIRNQTGQKNSADNILGFLKGSPLAEKKKEQVQDPYSFRCTPQVHGASIDAIAHIQSIIENEINAVTDNPLIFPEDDEILSGGNFHGQALAIHIDFLKIALAELGSISERRTFKLLSGVNGLPDFLVPKPGINSGLMIPQYAAAALVSANKQLATPASIDSITSSNGQEDHVSMGANAATQCYELLENLENILAIEFMTAAQAIEFRRPEKSSKVIEEILTDFRKLVPFDEEDHILYTEMEKTKDFILTINLEA